MYASSSLAFWSGILGAAALEASLSNGVGAFFFLSAEESFLLGAVLLGGSDAEDLDMSNEVEGAPTSCLAFFR